MSTQAAASSVSWLFHFLPAAVQAHVSGAVHASAGGTLLASFILKGDPGYIAGCLAAVLYAIKILEQPWTKRQIDRVKAWLRSVF